jgi:hypothetical protein
MTQTVRELLTELAWIEDSIRHLPMTAPAGGHTHADDEPSGNLDVDHRVNPGVNPDLIALAERERQIIDELRVARESSTLSSQN